MPGREGVEEFIGELDVPLAHRVKAMRTVASAAENADDCRMLLDMLGLKPRQARSGPDGRAAGNGSGGSGGPA